MSHRMRAFANLAITLCSTIFAGFDSIRPSKTPTRSSNLLTQRQDKVYQTENPFWGSSRFRAVNFLHFPSQICSFESTCESWLLVQKLTQWRALRVLARLVKEALSPKASIRSVMSGKTSGRTCDSPGCRKTHAKSCRALVQMADLKVLLLVQPSHERFRGAASS